jgi:hypothetical protein
LGVSENNSEEETQLGGFSGEFWTPKIDSRAFASILFEFLFRRPPQSEISTHTRIPAVVSSVIESRPSPISGPTDSFTALFEILKQNHFQIEGSVDSAEVSASVSSVESAEHPEKSGE